MNFGRIIGAGAAGLGLVGAGYAGLGGQDDTVRNDDGAVVEGGEVGAFRIRLGDCLQDISGTTFESVEAVPCADPHASEVYHAFLLTGAEWPGRDAVGSQADDGCFDAVETSLDLSIGLEEYGITSITPTEQSWDELDDREILCLVGRADGGITVGSVRYSG